MLSWIIGIKRIEKIRDGKIRARTGEANLNDEIREARLRVRTHKKNDS